MGACRRHLRALRHLILAAMLAGGLCCTSAAATTAAGPPNRIHALLIGEWAYSDAGLPDLNGPRNDIALMHDLLATRFGVQESAIATLSNPTHSQLQKAFQDLALRVQPGDIVYIHYSGHGSTAPDKADPRGEDQTWVPHGARVAGATGLDSMDVLDKEIALWLKPLYDRTPDVVFVSDSCHSATVSRGESRRGVRQVEAQGTPHPLLATIERVPAPATGVRIGAARDFESAVELEPTDGHACAPGSSTCYGVFTWNWAQALRESAPGTSWGDVFRRASARVSAVPGTYQRPQLEGRADRAVLQARFAPLTRTVEIREVGPDGAVVLGAGWLTGMSTGSRFAVAAPGTAPSAPAAAELVVKRVDGATSTAAVASGRVQAGDLAVETRHAVATPPVRLFVGKDDHDASASRALATALATSAARLNAYEQVSDRAAAELQVVPIVPKDCGANCEADEWQVQTAQGLLIAPVMRFDPRRAADEWPRLVGDLESFAWARQIRALGERGNPTALSLAVRSAQPPGGSSASCEESRSPGNRWKIAKPVTPDRLAAQHPLGECLSFEIANHDKYRNLYGYVVAIGPDFAVHLVWPDANDGADAARVEPGGKQASQAFYHLGQAGRESLVFLASDMPLDAALLQHEGARGTEPRSPLESALVAAANQRGDVQTAGQWGAIAIDLDVAAAKAARP